MTAEPLGATRQDRLDRTSNLSRERLMLFVQVIALFQNAL
jgi:hypothetical protein